MPGIPEKALEAFEAYIAQFRPIFPDLRLYKRFRQLNLGLLASGSTKISRVVSALPQTTKRPFHQAKAFYRLLANPRVSPEALLERVSQLSLGQLQGEEVYVLWDHRPIKKPRARRMEGISRVTRQRVYGYELLTGLALDGEGRLGLAYTHLLAYGSKEMKSLPHEILKGLEAASTRLRALGQKPIFILERRFDDQKVFQKLFALDLPFVAWVYCNHTLGHRVKGTRLRTLVQFLTQGALFRRGRGASWGLEPVSLWRLDPHPPLPNPSRRPSAPGIFSSSSASWGRWWKQGFERPGVPRHQTALRVLGVPLALLAARA